MTKNKQFLHGAVILLLMIGFGFLPPFSTVTPYGMQILGIFIGLVYAWSVGIVYWPSLLAFILFATVQHIPILTMLANMMNQQIMTCLVILIFCYALEVCGLMKWIGLWLLRQKIIKKGPYYMMAAFWVVSFVGSALCLSNLSIMIMLWSIFYTVAEQAGIKKYSTYSNIMLVGTAVISYVGSMFFPFALWPQSIFGIYTKATGQPFMIPYGLYFGMILASAAFTFFVGLAATKYIIKPKIDFDLSKIQLSEENTKMNRAQKFGAFSVLFMVAFALLSLALPAQWPLTVWISNMNIYACMTLAIIILSFFKDEITGKPIITIEELFRNGINWQTFMILGLAFYMAGLLTSNETGIFTALLGVMQPLLEGKSAAVTIIALVLISIAITNCLNNMVCASMIIPIAAALAPILNINITVLMLGLLIALIQGTALPSGSAIGALLHANKEWMKAKDVYMYAIFYTIIVAISVCVLCIILN